MVIDDSTLNKIVIILEYLNARYLSVADKVGYLTRNVHDLMKIANDETETHRCSVSVASSIGDIKTI